MLAVGEFTSTKEELFNFFVRRIGNFIERSSGENISIYIMKPDTKYQAS